MKLIHSINVNIINLIFQVSVVLTGLFLCIHLYFIIAKKYSIMDTPNNRSSHQYITIRGAGVIFPLGWFLYDVINGFNFIYFDISLLIISIVSFWDDVVDISAFKRLVIQSLVIILMLFEFEFSLIWVLLLIVPLILVVNGFNFMDGINGMTGLYSLVVLYTLFWINLYVIEYVEINWLISIVLPLFVFLFYNFRERAKCFAGDVGSVSISLIIIFLMLKLIISTHNIIFTLLVIVYAVDVILTILSRFFSGQNIFEPHRMHLYQKLSNEMHISQRIISIIYAITQMAINVMVIFSLQFNVYWQAFIAISIIGLLCSIHTVMKYYISHSLEA